MNPKPTYEELEQRVKALEEEAVQHREEWKALRESEETLKLAKVWRAFIDDTDTAFWQLDTAYTIVTSNRKARQIYGDDLEGKSCYRVAANRNTVCPECPVEEVFNGAKVGRSEHRRTDKDGNTIFIDHNATPIKDEKGEVSGALVQIIDMTERKKAEEDLRISEEKLRKVFQVSPTSIAITKLDSGEFIEVNKTFERDFGWSRNELVGKSLLDLNIWKNPADRERTVISLLLKQGYVHKPELELNRKSGETIVVDFHSSLIRIGDEDFIISNILDITERKQAEEERRKATERLQESEARFRAMFDMARDGILVTDIEAKTFLTGNLAICDMLGYTLDEILALGVADIHPEQDLPYVKEQFEKQAKGQITLATDIPVKKKNGSVFYADINSSPVSLTGRPCLLGVFRDTTEHRRLEEQLRQSQKMEAIGTLAGGVAHDFNNMLTTIIGNNEMLLDEISENDPKHEYSEEIKKAAQRAASLTRQLLAFSRKQLVQPRVLNFNEILLNLEKMVQRLIGEDIELKMIPYSDLYRVKADPGQMEQMIVNLVVNARDAMPKGGTITIETTNVDLDKDYFRDHGVENPPGPYVMMAVSDTGIGMDRETQSRIFEPFFTTKEMGKGTGLGLSTVYGIVKQNGGYIWSYSEPEKGTIMKVYLPIVEEDAVSVEEKEVSKNKLRGSETVLIVEDDRSLRKLARKALEIHGYRVLEAEDGEKGLRVVEEDEGPIQLLVTDVVMPGMDGREMADRLQSSKPGLKVIFMSGYTDDAIGHRGVLQSGVHFVEKPFSPESLARKAREVLDEK